jgi:hypothetical protein
MVQFSIGIFLMMHAAVHMLYAGQAGGLFELRPGLRWPKEAWLAARVLSERSLQAVGAGSMLLAALAFLAAGVGAIGFQGWWQDVTSGAAIFSTLLFLLFWNGKLKELDAQGAVGAAIDLALLAGIWVLG